MMTSAMLSGDVPFVHLSPRRPCDALRCYKRNCSAPVPEREDMAHAEAALCACGHLNKYCTICKAFFERVVPHPRPPDRDRMGYHYTGHPPRQNIACRELYRLATAPPCTCKDTDKAAKGQAAAPPAAAVSQVPMMPSLPYSVFNVEPGAKRPATATAAVKTEDQGDANSAAVRVPPSKRRAGQAPPVAAASSSECVDESDTDAAKLLLMMGAPL